MTTDNATPAPDDEPLRRPSVTWVDARDHDDKMYHLAIALDEVVGAFVRDGHDDDDIYDRVRDTISDVRAELDAEHDAGDAP